MLNKKSIVTTSVTTSAWQRSAIASVSLVSLLFLGSCDTVQPKPTCKVRSEDYAARYALQGTPTGMCDGKILTGEILHLGFYRDAKDYAEGLPSVAIESASVADLAADHEPHDNTEYALGKFTAVRTDDADMCKAPVLSEHTFVKDMTSLGYKWSNFQIIVKASSNAQHFGADLVRRDGDCEAHYKVTASSPAVFCGDGTKAKIGDDGMPVKDDQGNVVMEDDPTTGKPVAAKCANGPKDDFGLSPELVWVCDASDDGMTGTHLCLPKYDFPALGKK
jgi:hypothetical protein